MPRLFRMSVRFAYQTFDLPGKAAGFGSHLPSGYKKRSNDKCEGHPSSGQTRIRLSNTNAKFHRKLGSALNMFTRAAILTVLFLPLVAQSGSLPLYERDLGQDPFCDAMAGNGCCKDSNCIHTYGWCCSDSNHLMICGVGKWISIPCECKVETSNDQSCCVGLNSYGAFRDFGCPGTT